MWGDIFLLSSQLVILKRTSNHLLAKEYSQELPISRECCIYWVPAPKKQRCQLEQSQREADIKTTKLRNGPHKCQNLINWICSWEKCPTTFWSFPHQNIRFNLISFNALETTCFDCDHNLILYIQHY